MRGDPAFDLGGFPDQGLSFGDPFMSLTPGSCMTTDHTGQPISVNPSPEIARRLASLGSWFEPTRTDETNFTLNWNAFPPSSSPHSYGTFIFTRGYSFSRSTLL